MNLKELQSMIKEELENYIGEEEVDVDVDMDAGDVDAEVGDEEMGDEEDAASDEDVLRQIYDMLKAKFEGDEVAGDDMGMDDLDAEDDVEETYMENKEADLEEVSATGYDGKAGKGGTGYDGKAGKGGTGYDAGSKALQERFQKLANII
tara:strand:- start:1499 stop:1945 length:447 start_codon:yes stop_codon:yes gene_type:complete